jgi:hypothetical protein
MLDRLAAFIVGEGNWLPVAMGIGLIALLASLASRQRMLASMNLFTGVTLLVMGVGHVLAVTTKLMQGTLNGMPAILYVIGVAILVPALLLVRHARDPLGAKYNFWMAAVLIVLGLINIPLAIPAFLNIAYSRHSRPKAGQLILGAWVLVNLGLFAGGMLFMLSGAKTFEEFSR